MDLASGGIVILDCYTDEPSGYGVRPYLGTHQIHLSQALAYRGLAHIYLTIDDLRYASDNTTSAGLETDIRTLNRTKNCENALDILKAASHIFVIMGCFVQYKYFSAAPPTANEVFHFLHGLRAEITLFYVLGIPTQENLDFERSDLHSIVHRVEYGNTYRLILDGKPELIAGEPAYDLLDEISDVVPPILSQLRLPILAEIETGSGCDIQSCTFCIECARPLPPTFRSPSSVVKQIQSLYEGGVRHFRLGRQPNFYYYAYQDCNKMERMLSGIRECCPQIETLHIDNVNPLSVLSEEGHQITRLIIKYCTSGNVAPFGVESFDLAVRKAINKPGSPDQIVEAARIINEHGSIRGKDGFPRFLPGLNLIYGLPGQTPDSHKFNLEYLHAMYSEGLQTRRLFFRRLTSPYGISFGSRVDNSVQYEDWKQEIIDSFILPMQERVYPTGIVLKHFREVVYVGGRNLLRTLGSCSIKVAIDGPPLEPYGKYDVRIIRSLDSGLLEGELVSDAASEE
jgi:radical SAM superfamily enzyme with C-terminal helix-hairpin-helix motif